MSTNTPDDRSERESRRRDGGDDRRDSRGEGGRGGSQRRYGDRQRGPRRDDDRRDLRSDRERDRQGRPPFRRSDRPSGPPRQDQHGSFRRDDRQDVRRGDRRGDDERSPRGPRRGDREGGFRRDRDERRPYRQTGDAQDSSRYRHDRPRGLRRDDDRRDFRRDQDRPQGRGDRDGRDFRRDQDRPQGRGDRDGRDFRRDQDRPQGRGDRDRRDFRRDQDRPQGRGDRDRRDFRRDHDRPDRSERPSYRRDERTHGPRREERGGRGGFRTREGGRADYGRGAYGRRGDHGRGDRDRGLSREPIKRLPIPEDVTGEEIDKDVRQELRSLPKTLAEDVAKNLVMVARLLDEDPESAYSYAKVALRLASRVAAVREAAGFAAYGVEKYAEALAEFRAARRMTGSTHLWPVMADCERGLGRPERALAMAGEPEVRKLDKAGQVEMRLVAAGARRDMGQAEAAVVTLQSPELASNSSQPWTARLRYAYADALLAIGRESEAREWFAKALEADQSGTTNASDRLAQLDGVEFVDALAPDADDEEDEQLEEETAEDSGAVLGGSAEEPMTKSDAHGSAQ